MLTHFLAVLIASGTFGPGTTQPAAVDEAPAVIRATGIGRPPAGRPPAQARLMARRAAEVVAVRNLAAKVYGHHVESSGGTQRTTVRGLIRGHRYLPARVLPDGRVQVTVELPVRQIHGNYTNLTDRLTRVKSRLAQTKADLAATRDQLDNAQVHVVRPERQLATRPARVDLQNVRSHGHAENASRETATHPAVP